MAASSSGMTDLSESPSSAVRMEAITKGFPGVVANDGVDLSLKWGEIHGLLGENGAGKTVLMSILYGLYRPDGGRIFVRGEEVRISSPASAMALGIGMVHQHFMLVPRMTVLENIIVGREMCYGPFLNMRASEERVLHLAEEYGISVDPLARVEELSVGEQQHVEILKVLYRGAEILILDEPTAVLAEQEVESLFDTLRRLRNRGKNIVIIAHKLREVLSVCDRIDVLRRGRNAGSFSAGDVNEEDLAECMVGREAVLDLNPRESGVKGKRLLEVRDLNVLDKRGLQAVNGVSLEVREGEILGVAGIQGNGQMELVESLCGLRPPLSGRVLMEDTDVTGLSPEKLGFLGLVHIPEDRQRRGLILNFDLRENALLGRQRDSAFARGSWGQRRRVIGEYAAKLVGNFHVDAPSLSVQAGTLSGGNQQRLILAREFSRDPHVIIAVQPTRGLDVAGMKFVWRQLAAMGDLGCAVLLVSMDLDEVLAVADRIVVMREGRIVEDVLSGNTTKRDLGLMMLGGER